jgi:hypothetical protein
MVTIRLTPAERDAAEWAIDPMSCYWADQVEDGEVATMPDLPELVGDDLKLPEHEEVWADFLYRLEEQLPDMAHDQRGFESPQRLNADVRVAKSLARKIREVTGYTGAVL